MLSKGFAGRHGVMLSLIGIIATLWLAVTGKLDLYIHPRYVPFTVAMTFIAASASLAGFLTAPAGEDHTDREKPRSRLRAAGTLLLVSAAIIGLLLLPPTTLGSNAAKQRDLNVSGTLSKYQTSTLVDEDPATFNIRDWASLLRYSPGDAYFTKKTATITGFVTADNDDPANIFYVTRFVVTCCTVDAQPVGVPVRLPNWQKLYKPDSWITVSGHFTPNPGPSSGPHLLLNSPQTAATTQPPQPYVY